MSQSFYSVNWLHNGKWCNWLNCWYCHFKHWDWEFGYNILLVDWLDGRERGGEGLHLYFSSLSSTHIHQVLLCEFLYTHYQEMVQYRCKTGLLYPRRVKEPGPEGSCPWSSLLQSHHLILFDILFLMFLFGSTSWLWLGKAKPSNTVMHSFIFSPPVISCFNSTSSYCILNSLVTRAVQLESWKGGMLLPSC